MTEWIDIARVALAVGGLAAASFTDIRTREVPDGLWYGLALAALALFALDFDARFGGTAWVLVVAVGAVFAVAVTGGEILTVIPGDTVPEGPIELTEAQKRIWRIDQVLSLALLGAAAAVFLLAPGLDLGAPAGVLEGPEALALATCTMLGAGLVFYILGVLHGGGDAKGFMALVLLFPTAPALAGLPLFPPSSLTAQVLPFALVVLFNGALVLVVAAPLAFVGMGVRQGRLRFPYSLAGYSMPIAKVNLEREFLMGSVEDGAWRPRFLVSRATHADSRQKEALAFLKEEGQQDVFVSPKFPFMVYMLFGLVLAVAVTSPLYWI